MDEEKTWSQIIRKETGKNITEKPLTKCQTIDSSSILFLQKRIIELEKTVIEQKKMIDEFLADPVQYIWWPFFSVYIIEIKVVTKIEVHIFAI